jgi:hypothetical protein
MEEGKLSVSDSVSSPLSIHGIDIAEIRPGHCIDFVHNTDMIEHQRQVDWMKRLSTKMDTIFQLLDDLLSNQNQVKQEA